MFKNLSELKSGKECDGFITLISGADFRRDDRCFVSFKSEALCFFPLRKHDWLDWMTFGCHSKVFGCI
jgi:hypothetical protein